MPGQLVVQGNTGYFLVKVPLEEVRGAAEKGLSLPRRLKDLLRKEVFPLAALPAQGLPSPGPDNQGLASLVDGAGVDLVRPHHRAAGNRGDVDGLAQLAARTLPAVRVGLPHRHQLLPYRYGPDTMGYTEGDFLQIDVTCQFQSSFFYLGAGARPCRCATRRVTF